VALGSAHAAPFDGMLVIAQTPQADQEKEKEKKPPAAEPATATTRCCSLNRTVSLVDLRKLRKSHAAKFQVDHDAHQSTASPAEREQRYQQVLRELRDPKFYQIRITGMLLKRGYLWPNERDDLTALRQAVILFIWDTLRKKLKPNRKTEDKEIVRTRPCAY
jgi:hypothetical protein